MNKNSIFGKAKEIVGTMQELLGNALHNSKMASGGRHAQEAGREQGATGAATHAAKDAPKKVELNK